MRARLSPEEALVVAAAGGRYAACGPSTGAIDWQRAVDLAAWHRVVPLLWDHLRSGRAGIDAPAEVAAGLRQAARESTARSLNLGMELDKALDALGAQGIPVVLLKGAALVETVYEHPGLRPMGDLDLLVPRPDIERAHQALTDIGYEVKARLHRDDDSWLVWIHHHLPLYKQDGSVMVELHHGVLVDRPDFDVDGLWARAVPSDRAPAHLLPSQEDLLLHVAAHFALDRMNRAQSALGQLADVVHLVGRGSVDWDAVVGPARQSKVADRVFLALSSANQLFGEVAPREVVAGLAPASYTARRGELFLRERVLHGGSSFPLEQLRGGRRRVFPGAAGLEWYIRRDDEVVPSRARLQVRRAVWVSRRIARGLPGPVKLVRDVRLSRWMVSLRS